jgi:hypothetical protein
MAPARGDWSPSPTLGAKRRDPDTRGSWTLLPLLVFEGDCRSLRHRVERCSLHGIPVKEHLSGKYHAPTLDRTVPRATPRAGRRPRSSGSAAATAWAPPRSAPPVAGGSGSGCAHPHTVASGPLESCIIQLVQYDGSVKCQRHALPPLPVRSPQTPRGLSAGHGTPGATGTASAWRERGTPGSTRG